MSHEFHEFGLIMVSRGARVTDTLTLTPLYLAGARGRHLLAPGLADGNVSVGSPPWICLYGPAITGNPHNKKYHKP